MPRIDSIFNSTNRYTKMMMNWKFRNNTHDVDLYVLSGWTNMCQNMWSCHLIASNFNTFQSVNGEFEKCCTILNKFIENGIQLSAANKREKYWNIDWKFPFPHSHWSNWLKISASHLALTDAERSKHTHTISTTHLFAWQRAEEFTLVSFVMWNVTDLPLGPTHYT